ncbi:L-tartrate/succinate antiporter [Methylobacterium hispanicum]|uniref:L-tartrate/succinate antiporter n=1 Tax=Methylobacterium hispanicum TaxID=270350 RepID=A0AAV4ZG39_9HYPH|nr:SLC13 family permease [Methylobacterium hispanicum]GJD87278.1 L-tartrate/succinate antiporter [Methylobacterium hispanicum]
MTHPSKRTLSAVGALAALCIAVTLPEGLDWPARAALLAFGGAAVFWTLTDLSGSYVAVAAALFLVAVRGVEQQALIDGLGSKVVWLVIGTFVLGAAVEKSGLAGRLTALVAGRGTTVGGLMWRLTLGIVPLAFLIPSTSGRATVLLPLYRGLTEADDDERVARAVGLLIPAVIVISTICSLTGAGSHLVAVDLLERLSDRTIGFGQWMLWGLPFGLAASLMTTFLVSRLFLDGEARARPIGEVDAPAGPLSPAEWRTGAVVAAMLGLWLTEGYHPFGIATVAVAGAVLLTMPGLGVLTWNEGVEAVNWSLVLFITASLVLGRALISTGAAKWLITSALGASGVDSGSSPLLVMLGLLALGMTAHLYMVSHTARVAALLPPLLLLSHRLGLNPLAVAFLANVGMDYCLTLPVSSKALLIFQDGDRPAFSSRDLLRLSAFLAPAYAALMVVAYLVFWSRIGLAL